MSDERISDEELAALRAHAPPPWRWSGWNFGGDHFWGRDDLEGSLIAADGQEILRGVTTEGEDPRVIVLNKSSARLIELAPRLLEEVRRLRETEDPITKLRERLELSDEEFGEVDAEVTEIVEASVEFAKAGTDPAPEDALKNVYA